MKGHFVKVVHECAPPTEGQHGVPPFGIGSIWECECGTRWMYKNFGRGRPEWVPQVPSTSEGTDG